MAHWEDKIVYWEKLKKDYVENVIPHILKNIKEECLLSYSSGAASGKFAFEPYMDTILNCSEQFKPLGKNFIHFTSIKALHSILNEMSLRMYSLNNMNDPQEFEWLAKEFGYNDFLTNLFKKSTYVLSLMNSDVINTSNALTLWRLYGGEGNGCLIEFEIEPDHLQSTKLVNVVYGKPDFTKFFKANKEFEERNKIEVDLKGLIKLLACFYKDELYSIENEVRLFHEDRSPNEVLNHQENHPYRYDFNASGKIVSYYKLDLYREEMGYPNIKIKRIQLGFKFKEEDRENIEKHIGLIFYSMSQKLGIGIETPIIEISPLKGTFV